jgi:hypothetical protein
MIAPIGMKTYLYRYFSGMQYYYPNNTPKHSQQSRLSISQQNEPERLGKVQAALWFIAGRFLSMIFIPYP